jgi:hypothetical protein
MSFEEMLIKKSLDSITFHKILWRKIIIEIAPVSMLEQKVSIKEVYEKSYFAKKYLMTYWEFRERLELELMLAEGRAKKKFAYKNY